ncbi:MAG: cob(I)yrinic acid a,c-diamide adenosyltransferase [Salinivirgaceae bacterium]|jgi:cob(I)alamin adenosyltransferase|nr:cob(I)yrinic acid a,c-diamide adenosyltransferase [Salinivirgaceae bacterium]
MEQGLIQVYTGDGKGKTTAAMGLAVRALGNNFKVKILQFFKSELSGEVAPLKKLGAEITLCNGQDKPTWTMNSEEEKILIHDTKLAWEIFKQSLKTQEYDLIILDEANHALNREYISKKELLEALNQPHKSEIVFTGRNAPQWLMDRADLVTEMKMHKHPYQKGIPARIGIEK